MLGLLNVRFCIPAQLILPFSFSSPAPYYIVCPASLNSYSYFGFSKLLLNLHFSPFLHITFWGDSVTTQALTWWHPRAHLAQKESSLAGLRVYLSYESVCLTCSGPWVQTSGSPVQTRCDGIHLESPNLGR